MTALRVSREQVIAYRVAAQGLHRSARTVGGLAILDIGVQDSGVEAARLAIDARLTGTPPTGGIGPGEPIALAWSLRAAPYVHRRRDLPRLAAALVPLSDADASKRLGETGARLKKAGVAGLDGFRAGVQAISTVVTAAMAKGAASAAVTRAGPDYLSRSCRACQCVHVSDLVLRLGSLQAGLELEPGTSPPVLVPSFTPEPADPAAATDLVANYLRLLGPAQVSDAAGYLDARRADVQAIWPPDLTEISVDGTAAWVPTVALGALRSAPAPELVRLLGPFDPYLQARDRNLIVPDASIHKLLWPVLGRPGVLLVDGEVVGMWRTRATGTRLQINVETFGPLDAPTWSAVEEEAGRVAAVRGATAVDMRRGG